VKFDFEMTRLDYRDNFKIIPESGVLAPNEVKEIAVRFSSKDELKLPKGNVADIAMNILEGESLEKFDKVMINVAVNSIFSKYMLKPNKMISLPPLLYDDSKTVQFEIVNTCQFPFNYNIFDYEDEETRKEIKRKFKEK
jgi:hypothetical protein